MAVNLNKVVTEKNIKRDDPFLNTVEDALDDLCLALGKVMGPYEALEVD